ncbi:MAG: hypothetical protein JO316_02055 [Abitibacteriaceae bacterium]|nr:hypothetical protein [Abditibacteriaceae bacterium]
MKKHGNRLVALGTLGVMAASTVGGLGVTAAQASSKSKRNLAIGLGAVTAYGLLKHNNTVAIAGGIGTALAYKSYRKDKKKEDAREAQRQQWYQQRYGSNWRSHYKPGA